MSINGDGVASGEVSEGGEGQAFDLAFPIEARQAQAIALAPDLHTGVDVPADVEALKQR